MHITVTSASTRTGTASIRWLFEQASQNSQEIHIEGLYRDPSKAERSVSSRKNFSAKKGSIVNQESLDLTSSDAVLFILPPISTGTDSLAQCQQMCNNVKRAIEASKTIRKMVLLSSMGAEFDQGTGELMTNNISEQVMLSVAGPEIIIVRCSYFMENWTAYAEGLKAPEPFFFSPLTPIDYKMPMVAVEDIGKHIANVLLDDTRHEKQHICDLQGPDLYSPLDVKDALSKVVGREVTIKPVPQDQLGSFFGAVFSEHVADLFVEMTKSVLPGGIAAQDSPLRDISRPVIKGTTTLGEAFESALKV